ncbi:MAG TPA: MGMT family protein [Candidatus Levybacteria bacterium]|nr:MGMT family protein [Candidatus Levybacteria bacterium]
MKHSSFKDIVYAITQKIPAGKVMTYGQVAKLAGNPNAARAVGMCMSKNTDTKKIPCHRVVASNGKLTGYAFGGVITKAELLKKEGVIFKGETVDLSASLWNFPKNN